LRREVKDLENRAAEAVQFAADVRFTQVGTPQPTEIYRTLETTGKSGTHLTLLCENNRRWRGQRSNLRSRTNLNARRVSWGKGRPASEQRMPRAVSRKDFLRFGVAGLAGAALLGIAGCRGSLSSNRKVVRLLTGAEETTTQERAVAEIQVDGFEEQHPDIDLQREAIQPDELREVIKTRLQSEEPPDAFAYDTGPGFGGVLADAGLLYPLEKAYEQRGWNIYDWAKQRATYNGTVYGVPDQVEEIIVYYNTDLFERLGWAEPKTVDELREIADELKERGKIPLVFGNREQYPAGHMFSIGASNVLGREGLDDIFYGDGRWDTTEVVETIDLFFRDFVHSGYYPEGVNVLTYDEANALFYSGQAAMNPTGTWLVPEIVQTVQDFEVGFFPFPSIGGSSISPPAGVGTGWFVAKDAKNPEGAITFIDYLLEDSTARLMVEKLNTIPAHPVKTEGLDVSELFKQVLEDLSRSPQDKSFGYNIDVLAPQNFNEVMFSGFQEVLNGSRSAEEQARALQEAWAEAKEAGKTPTQG
jgi:raffinose/stachyose/melibiose transport system substrate-binding protein